jgi:hypothetical protein
MVFNNSVEKFFHFFLALEFFRQIARAMPFLTSMDAGDRLFHVSSDIAAPASHRITRLRMIWHNLQARPLRSVLSVVAISLQVFLVLLIVGLTTGVLADWGERVEGVGADLMVNPPNSSIFFAFSSAVMQESIADQIAGIPGVDEVAPVFIVVDGKKLNTIYGIDEPRFEGLSKGFRFLSGHGLEQPDDAIADDWRPNRATFTLVTPSSSLITPFISRESSFTEKVRAITFRSARRKTFPGPKSAFP